jgi:hypothetical protein
MGGNRGEGDLGRQGLDAQIYMLEKVGILVEVGLGVGGGGRR